MVKRIVVIGDAHALPGKHNERATWIGRLVVDLKPDHVINIGDCADMLSLCSYDKNSRAAIGRSYSKDIEAACDFNDRIRHEIRKQKKRRPRMTILEGNHEHRIEKALDQNPELDGTVSFSDLQYEYYYDDVVRYDGQSPGVFTDSGIIYAHYLPSGALGRAIGGEHLAYSLLTKKFVSCTVGHDHRLDYCIRSRADGVNIMGLSVGACMDYPSTWAGQSADSWWNGVIVKDNVENGTYDLRAISIGQLKKEYGK